MRVPSLKCVPLTSKVINGCHEYLRGHRRSPGCWTRGWWVDPDRWMLLLGGTYSKSDKFLTTSKVVTKLFLYCLIVFGLENHYLQRSIIPSRGIFKVYEKDNSKLQMHYHQSKKIWYTTIIAKLEKTLFFPRYLINVVRVK